eukprot:10184881-Lingulodinium_polyedra.AAC.1
MPDLWRGYRTAGPPLVRFVRHSEGPAESHWAEQAHTHGPSPHSCGLRPESPAGAREPAPRPRGPSRQAP